MPRTIEVAESALGAAHQSQLATRMGIEDMISVCQDLDRIVIEDVGEPNER